MFFPPWRLKSSPLVSPVFLPPYGSVNGPYYKKQTTWWLNLSNWSSWSSSTCVVNRHETYRAVEHSNDSTSRHVLRYSAKELTWIVCDLFQRTTHPASSKLKVSFHIDLVLVLSFCIPFFVSRPLRANSGWWIHRCNEGQRRFWEEQPRRTFKSVCWPLPLWFRLGYHSSYLYKGIGHRMVEHKSWPWTQSVDRIYK
jgi:hypothetical protein